MEYVFGFNIACDLYKVYPSLQIYLDNKLVDEFDLNEQHLYQKIEQYRFGLLDRSLKSKKVHLYTFKEEDLKNEIRIEVKNQDSNYTNGFMTKSTRIEFTNIFLMPKKFTDPAGIVELYDTATPWEDTPHVEYKENRIYIENWPTSIKNTKKQYGGDQSFTFKIQNKFIYKHLEDGMIEDHSSTINDRLKDNQFFTPEYLGFGKHDDTYVCCDTNFLSIARYQLFNNK